MSTRDFEFKLKEAVKIIPLGCKGRVDSIWITETGVKYQVRYFDKAEVKDVYFFADELKKDNAQ